jgi:Domain of unknown function (DUF4145)
MNIKVQGYSAQNSNTIVKLRCPVCHQKAVFESLISQDAFVNPDNLVVGIRRCPDPACKALVFVVLKSGANGVEISYPAERIDFDGTNIPAAVLTALEEAITCHANQCFTAAAIMVRKTLEVLCSDRGAKGNNLKDRIKVLGNKVVLPTELLEGLDDLRLLGNDAAHIESEEYNKVGQEEVEIGIEFAKEVLKAVYQYSALLNRLRALKKTET